MTSPRPSFNAWLSLNKLTSLLDMVTKKNMDNNDELYSTTQQGDDRYHARSGRRTLERIRVIFRDHRKVNLMLKTQL